MKFSCCALDRDQLDKIAKGLKGTYNFEDIINIFKLLAHPIRFKILQILVVESEICACELTDLYDESQPAITKQLTKLRREKILTSRKVTFKEEEDGQWKKEEKDDGKWTAYRLAKDKKALITHLMKPFIDSKILQDLPAIAIAVDSNSCNNC
ncbi:MAG: ArsR/SmtB family transcription factor [Candidatus Hodarchaeota archaeon]